MPDPSTARGRIYKVRWKGFAELKDSWEPLSGFVPRYTSVWLDYVKAKNMKLDVKYVLVYMVRRPEWGPSLLLHAFSLRFNFLYRSDIHTVAQNRQSIHQPNFLDRNQDQSWIVFMFFVHAQSVAACSGDSHRTMIVKAPSSFLSFGGSLR